MFQCLSCSKSFEKKQGLMQHVVRGHEMSRREYSLRYEYDGKIPLCLCGCGKETEFTCSHGWSFKKYVNGHIWVGVRRTEENREKLRIVNLGEKNPNFGNPTGYHPNEATKKIMSEKKIEFFMKNPGALSGEKNGAWNGGISRNPYVNFGRALKRRIKERDSHKCVVCGDDHRLSVHHVDYDKKNSSDENFATLCASCHSKTNFNREDWKQKLIGRSL